METESSSPSRRETSEQDPASARNEDQSRERVLGSDVLEMEGDFVGLDENKLRLSEILDQVHEKASSVLEFSLKWEEIDEQYTSMENLLKERTMEVELKEKFVMDRIVELEKKEERLKEVEERERKIELLEKSSMTVRLEEKEKENDMKRYLESSVMRLVREKANEEVTNELEERGKEVERLSKSNDKKSCELDKAVKEFDLKQKESIERRSKEAELMGESLKQLEAREKELSLLDESVKEKLTELEKKEAIFEAEQKAKAEEMELKSKYLEVKEKKLEEREKELELKQRELEERSIQAETCKRSRGNLLAEKGCEADSLIRPSKRHKSLGEQIENEEKETDSTCVVSLSASASSLEQIHEAHEEEIDEIVSKGETDEDPEQLNCVDSEFHDFNKTMSSFVVGKVWALYDPIDYMPRLYAKIKRIIKFRSSIEVRWIEPRDEESVPVACGRFRYGITETVKSHLTFSHEMHPIIHGRNYIAVNPIKGETWALFRDWSKSWNNNPEQHKPPYRYDIVEVVLSFDDHLGVGVSYLGKVEGFVSVFKPAAQHGVFSLVITPEEMNRFSHRVPSFRLNGEEKEGVPAGSFELDPAAIPSSILKLDHSVREEAKETQGQDTPIIILD